MVILVSMKTLIAPNYLPQANDTQRAYDWTVAFVRGIKAD